MPMLAIPAAIQAGTSIIGGIFGSRSAKKAAKQIGAAATKQAGETRATGEQVTGRLEDVYNQGQAGFDPYAQAGEQGLRSLSDFLTTGGGAQEFKFDPAKAAVDPSLQFRIDQGNQAIMRNRLAKGLASGGTLKALTQYSQDLASQEYQNMFNRALAEYGTKNDVYSRLMGLTGLGYNAAAAKAGLGMDFGRTAGGFDMATQEAINNLLMTGAGAQASGTMGSGNAWQNALSGVGTAASNFMAQRSLRDLLGQQGGGSVPVSQLGNLMPPSVPAMAPSDLFSGVDYTSLFPK